MLNKISTRSCSRYPTELDPDQKEGGTSLTHIIHGEQPLILLISTKLITLELDRTHSRPAAAAVTTSVLLTSKSVISARLESRILIISVKYLPRARLLSGIAFVSTRHYRRDGRNTFYTTREIEEC